MIKEAINMLVGVGILAACRVAFHHPGQHLQVVLAQLIAFRGAPIGVDIVSHIVAFVDMLCFIVAD